ncbi:MAG: sulfatase-like hydrolase/transferase [Planctomycetes bacterium]|nr:sulfatase-like hydrolase/transferase [Planctomycetota bacterium]
MTASNILFIITDHHAWYGHFIGADGLPGGISPVRLGVWDRFCRQGVLFTGAYAVCPLCTPARASMLSGLTPQQHGMAMNCDGGGDFAPGTELYNRHLERAGYRSAYVGKWHCGHRLLPADYGFDGWSLADYGKIYMSEAYQAYCRQHGLGPARARIDHFFHRPEWKGAVQTLHHESPWAFMNGSGVLQGPRAGHEEDFVADLACGQLRKLAGDERPFNLVASFWGPHQPYFPSEPFAGMVDPSRIPEHPSHADDLSDKPSRYHLHRSVHHPGVQELTSWADWQPIVARCYEQCLQTDAAVGLVLDELERSGRAGNTIVVWCADHGDALAGHGGCWDKAATMSEEVMRIPLAVRWPGRIPAGKVVSDPVSNLDCPATLLEAADCAIPGHWRSRSLLPAACGQAQREHVICEHHGHSGTVIEQRMLRLGRWKYVAALYDGDELYDLDKDPWELNNHIDDPACEDVAADCRSRLAAYVEAEPQNGLTRRLAATLRFAAGSGKNRKK